MKLLKPTAELIFPSSYDKLGLEKFIEQIGRTCYLSFDKITEISYRKFIDNLIKSEHYAMLEFGTIYLTTSNSDIARFYTFNPYSKIRDNGINFFITTNYRVVVENERLSDLEFMTEPSENHYKRITIRFTTSRSVTHEIVRHRKASFAQLSQRYVCYGLEKFGGEISFIIPKKIFLLAEENKVSYKTEREMVEELSILNKEVKLWYHDLLMTENNYLELIRSGWKAQEARDILPNSCSSIINVCMFEEDWEHFFDLRSLGTTGAPDPNMKYIADEALKKMKENGFLKNERFIL